MIAYLGTGIMRNDILVLEICEKYGWTWQQYQSTPSHIIELAIEKMKVEKSRAEQARAN